MMCGVTEWVTILCHLCDQGFFWFRGGFFYYPAAINFPEKANPPPKSPGVGLQIHSNPGIGFILFIDELKMPPQLTEGL